MFSSLLITFREALEVALLIGVILRLESRLEIFNKLKQTVYLGVGMGLVASGILAILFQKFAGGFTGRAEQIFEGVIFIIGAGTLLSVVFWLKHEQAGSGVLGDRAKKFLQLEEWWGMFFLIFFSVLRDGVETVLYLTAAGIKGDLLGLLGALVGGVVAMAVGYGVYKETNKINIQKFFSVTSILLILFAVSLLIRGLAEFVELGLFGKL